MICPTCGTHIPDGSLVCPACHASVGVTVAMPVLRGRWCPACGVAMDWEETVCPNCGLPVEQAWGAPQPTEGEVAAPGPEPVADQPLAPPASEEPVSESDDTRAIPRIESAIPPEHDPDSKVAAQEMMPRTRAMLLAGVASILLVLGLALAITHPWDPDPNSIKATKEQDTSMAGFPGTVESLTGQDSNGSTGVEVPTGDEATLTQLVEAYQKLGRYAKRADDNEALFESVAITGDLTERTEGKRAAEALSIDVSNLIALLGEVDVSSGTYAEDQDHLLTLGNWLRNRVDNLTIAWRADIDSTDPPADEQDLIGLLHADWGQDGQSTYKTLFDENYAQWEPKAAQGQ